MDPNKPQGNGAPEAPQGDEQPQKFVTAEDLNRAISARFTAFEKKNSAAMSEALKGFSSGFEELLSSKLDGLKPQGSSEPAKPMSVQESPEFKSLQKQMAAIQARADEAEKLRAAAESKSRDTRLREALREELVRNGVDGARAKHAIGYLVDAEKRAKWSDDGETILFNDAKDGDLTLADGVKSWARGDEAKFYQAPRNVSGSGDRGEGKAPQARPGQPQKGDLGRAILAMTNFGTNNE